MFSNNIMTCQARTALVKFSLRNLIVYFLLCQLAHLGVRTKGFLDRVSSLLCGLAVYWRPCPLGMRQYVWFSISLFVRLFVRFSVCLSELSCLNHFDLRPSFLARSTAKSPMKYKSGTLLKCQIVFISRGAQNGWAFKMIFVLTDCA